MVLLCGSVLDASAYQYILPILSYCLEIRLGTGAWYGFSSLLQLSLSLKENSEIETIFFSEFVRHVAEIARGTWGGCRFCPRGCGLQHILRAQKIHRASRAAERICRFQIDSIMRKQSYTIVLNVRQHFYRINHGFHWSYYWNFCGQFSF